MNFWKLDVPVNYQIGFQDPSSPVMEEIISFHNYTSIYISLILVGVFWMIFEILFSFKKTRRFISHKYLVHGTFIEIVWTITPAIILVLIAYPSFKLLYLIDEVLAPALTIKAIGHQWYWSYEYSDYATSQEGLAISFDSYLVPEESLEFGAFRMLEVDNRILIPVDHHVRVVITAADVLHSWAVPSLGVKLDAVPGRLNQTSFIANRTGVFYGQCSEICGFGHAAMPIVVEAVDLGAYCAYIDSLLQEAKES